MYQLVNLYQPVFRQQPKILSAVTLVTITVIAMILMLALYLVIQSRIQSLQRTSADLALSYSQLNARLDTIAAMKTVSENNATDDEFIALQDRIKEHEAILTEIDRLFVESSGGYGEIFESLALINLPGLWLTGVQLGESGNVKIRGATLDPKLVPRYMQLITQQPKLALLSSGTVNLIRDEPDLTEVDFELSYFPPEAGK